jgi:hypothetical protein
VTAGKILPSLFSQRKSFLSPFATLGQSSFFAHVVWSAKGEPLMNGFNPLGSTAGSLLVQSILNPDGRLMGWFRNRQAIFF